MSDGEASDGATGDVGDGWSVEADASEGRSGHVDANDAATDDPVALSVAYLRAVRLGEDSAGPRDALAALDEDALAAALDGDDARYAFWLNVYNAAVQDLLERDPSLLASRRSFFGADRVQVAGRTLSLDAIEHGLLRRSRWKLGAGYLPAPFPSAFERRFRVDERDPRVHFGLNCGAASCPPVAAYTPETVDDTLDGVTATYLERTVEYDPAGWLWDGVVTVPRLFLWYRGDFGGKSGVLAFIRRYGLLPAGVRPRLSHREYDWSLKLGEFADGPPVGGGE